MTDLKPGDRVCFSRAFLRNTGQFTGRVPFLTGHIVSLENLGGDLVIAFIHWDDDVYGRVNVHNLIRADRKHLEPV